MLQQLARERGRAVVVVTHDARILPFAHRVVRMEDGMFCQNGLNEHEPLSLPPGMNA
jgi:putative ABC transport system ATP-binding protein